eukprot:gnl/TRDRNA2_/TRDRNA2_138223_c0_seq1.p1 gnl/TRDRNA2_/TRDRNA2_138223_c0~~gnl/TRDRNA2_/TRDRNA2_138223_c0_seq1.p1  ORF type:complete len:198 (+),score=27.85 gnl/TRDRNA2_/TRDRNA2_138223_c0_seq1:89-595(+)
MGPLDQPPMAGRSSAYASASARELAEFSDVKLPSTASQGTQTSKSHNKINKNMSADMGYPHQQQQEWQPPTMVGPGGVRYALVQMPFQHYSTSHAYHDPMLAQAHAPMVYSDARHWGMAQDYQSANYAIGQVHEAPWVPVILPIPEGPRMVLGGGGARTDRQGGRYAG